MDLKTQIQVCMFDQYGTVVDMQAGLVEFATPFLQAKGWTGSPNAFVTWWRRTHFENSMIDALLCREHTSYRAIGEAAVAHVMDRAGIGYSEADVQSLVAAIERLRPFPEVPPHWTACARATAWWCCRTATRTCWKPRNGIMGSRSTT